MERDARADSSDAGAEGVRAPSASVFFHDAEATSRPRGEIVTPRSVRDGERSVRGERDELSTGFTRKRRIAFTGAIALFLVAGAAAPFALTRRPASVEVTAVPVPSSSFAATAPSEQGLAASPA